MSHRSAHLYGATHLLLIKDNKVLLLLRKNTGWRDGEYSVPAGHIEPNENARLAMVREAREEVGLAIAPEDLRFSSIVHRHAPDREYMDFFFTLSEWDGEVKNGEPDKCEALAWYDINSLPANVISYIKHGIENHKNSISFSEFGWEI
ncbi:MAG: hypothetical protein A3A33_04830 [Candidatus Yanofskybacteria bacterium RIFCSPLOWO2_01_FULL_49_25]|uniref:Nudix hydrolase domain-containing protein n=1 Tax=Candidatus Yanofskybacteria bacterium RIFCSPLOWO2_01_FULL_49_25 TaxID=1802701 RepID=A0A1F8GS90_9BACT|nr:MAG: hypothetical protein A3A33_04830 [Candidatus Yanofskybacteria bacterium RIFCSPLOWO2_01_FULL_49_25]